MIIAQTKRKVRLLKKLCTQNSTCLLMDGITWMRILECTRYKGQQQHMNMQLDKYTAEVLCKRGFLRPDSEVMVLALGVLIVDLSCLKLDGSVDRPKRLMRDNSYQAHG